MSVKAIVLDANILIRAVLGKRVRELIFDSVITVKFFAPDVAYADARKYLPARLKKRGVDSSAGMLVLDRLEGVVQSIDPVRGKPCRLGQCQERGRQGCPCAGFSVVSVVAQCTGG